MSCIYSGNKNVQLETLSGLMYLDEGPHRKQVGKHGRESLCQAALGNEARLQLSQADGIVTLPPVPAGNIQQMGLEPCGADRRNSD